MATSVLSPSTPPAAYPALPLGARAQPNGVTPSAAALNLTPSAEARIAALMAQAPADAVGVKLSTPRRGCSGLAYSVDYVTEADPFDEKIVTPGGTTSMSTADRSCT
jgi:hypothetical protein